MMLKLLMATALVGSFAFADTAEEKVNDAKRSAKKSIHNMQDKHCKKGDMKCAEQKIDHKAEEAKDYVKDKKNEND